MPGLHEASRNWAGKFEGIMPVKGEEEGLGSSSNLQEAPPRKQEGGPELSSGRGEAHFLLMEPDRVAYELLLPLVCLVLKEDGGCWGTSRIPVQATLSAFQ